MAQRFLLGWEEWLSLPDLGLPAIKAKVDTGAKTSALHAFTVDTFGPIDRPKVRFAVHPIPGRDDVEVVCTADVVDRREVTSSNGERENRFVIRTNAAIGDRVWPIEITLARRETMAYRMLLGRQAIGEDMFVDATTSFHQPKLSYKVYGAPVRAPGLPAGRVIGLMTRRPDNPSIRRLVRAGERRGHKMLLIDRTRLSLYIAAVDPGLYLDGRPLGRLDAIVARAARTLNAFTLAAIRQMEILGAAAINPADALARVGDTLAVRQMLARSGLTVPETAVSHADLLREGRADAHVLADAGDLVGAGATLRLAVIGGRALAVIEREPRSALGERTEWRASTADPATIDTAKLAAEAAARTLGLGLALADVAVSRLGPMVIDVTANVSISQFDRLCGTSLADAVIVYLEQERGRGVRPA